MEFASMSCALPCIVMRWNDWPPIDAKANKRFNAKPKRKIGYPSRNWAISAGHLWASAPVFSLWT